MAAALPLPTLPLARCSGPKVLLCGALLDAWVGCAHTHAHVRHAYVLWISYFFACFFLQAICFMYVFFSIPYLFCMFFFQFHIFSVCFLFLILFIFYIFFCNSYIFLEIHMFFCDSMFFCD